MKMNQALTLLLCSAGAITARPQDDQSDSGRALRRRHGKSCPEPEKTTTIVRTHTTTVTEPAITVTSALTAPLPSTKIVTDRPTYTKTVDLLPTTVTVQGTTTVPTLVTSTNVMTSFVYTEIDDTVTQTSMKTDTFTLTI